MNRFLRRFLFSATSFSLLFVECLNAATFTNAYDPLNRLTNAAYSDGSREAYSYDAAGNRLARTTRAATTNLDSISPTSPANVSTPSPATNQVAFFWNRAFDTGGSGLAGYNIYVNGILTGSTTTTNYVLSNLLAATTYCVSIAAYDRSGNVSARTPDACFTTPGLANTNAPTVIFADDFNDNLIDPAKWMTSGYTIQETNQYMRVGTDATDNGGLLTNKPVPINPSGDITITRKVRLHYANNNYVGDICMKFGAAPWSAVYYANASYDSDGHLPRYGTYIGKNGVAPDGAHFFVIETSNQTNVSQAYPVLWDTWFDEKIIYSPTTGVLQYFTNNQSVGSYNIGIMPPTNNPTLQLGFRAWGWGTGHQQLFDDLVVSQSATPASVPQLTAIKVGTNGVISFTITGLVGSNYVIQVSSNLVNWLLYSAGTIPTIGSIVIADTNTTGQARRFYRAVSSAFVESFTNAPNYTNNWQLFTNTGTTVTTYTSGNFRVQASRSNPYPPGSAFTLLSKDAYVGDIDYSVLLNHQGRGRTTVGLWSVSSNNWSANVALDTDDTDYLNFISGTFATNWKYAGTPYMNRWITLRIRTVGTVVQFYADGVLLESPSFTASGVLRVGIAGGSVPWKSGDNDTSFRIVTVEGTKQ